MIVENEQETTMLNFDDEIEVGKRRFECNHRDHVIYSRVNDVRGSKIVSYECHGFMSSQKLDAIKAEIDAKIEDREQSIKKSAARSAEKFKEENNEYWSKILISSVLGGVGFTFGGPFGACAGIVIGAISFGI